MRTTETRHCSVAAKAFAHTRRNHKDEIAEDYTELIAELIEEQGEARVTEIARHLGVSHVTAIRTIQRLKKNDLVATSRHKPVVLTEKGESLARQCRERHGTLVRFLVALGVPKKIADIDVEGIEHHISPTTLRAIEKFLGNQAT